VRKESIYTGIKEKILGGDGRTQWVCLLSCKS
jgi:hypothetical protein